METEIRRKPTYGPHCGARLAKIKPDSESEGVRVNSAMETERLLPPSLAFTEVKHLSVGDGSRDTRLSDGRERHPARARAAGPGERPALWGGVASPRPTPETLVTASLVPLGFTLN